MTFMIVFEHVGIQAVLVATRGSPIMKIAGTRSDQRFKKIVCLGQVIDMSLDSMFDLCALEQNEC